MSTRAFFKFGIFVLTLLSTQGVSESFEVSPFDAARNRGLLLFVQGKYQQAEKEYEAALKTRPAHQGQLALCYAELGDVLKRQGKTEAATAMYEKALSLGQKWLSGAQVDESRNFTEDIDRIRRKLSAVSSKETVSVLPPTQINYPVIETPATSSPDNTTRKIRWQARELSKSNPAQAAALITSRLKDVSTGDSQQVLACEQYLYSELVKIQLAMRDTVSAKKSLHRLLTIQENWLWTGHPYIALTKLTLASLEDSGGDQSASENYYRDVLTNKYVSPRTKALAIQGLNGTLIRQNKLREARQLCVDSFHRSLLNKEQFRNAISLVAQSEGKNAVVPVHIARAQLDLAKKNFDGALSNAEIGLRELIMAKAAPKDLLNTEILIAQLRLLKKDAASAANSINKAFAIIDKDKVLPPPSLFAVGAQLSMHYKQLNDVSKDLQLNSRILDCFELSNKIGSRDWFVAATALAQDCIQSKQTEPLDQYFNGRIEELTHLKDSNLDQLVLLIAGTYFQCGATEKARLWCSTFYGIQNLNPLSRALLGNTWAYILYSEGDYKESEKLYEKVLAVLTSNKDFSPGATALAWHWFADGLYRQKRYAESERGYNEAIKIYRSRLGSDKLSLALSVHGLARAYMEQHRYAKARPLFAEAVALGRAAKGMDAGILEIIEANNAKNLLEDKKRGEQAAK